MLELGSISLSIFSYVTEENDRIVQALHNCLPSELKSEKLNKISSNSQFGDPFVIYSYETDDPQHIKIIAKYIGSKLDDKSQDYLLRNLSKKVDLENRSIYFRLDKYKAYQDELFITEGSDIIRVELAYNAYTKKQNSLENVKEILKSFHLIP